MQCVRLGSRGVNHILSKGDVGMRIMKIRQHRGHDIYLFYYMMSIIALEGGVSWCIEDDGNTIVSQ